jgi:hypothetical protein
MLSKLRENAALAALVVAVLALFVALGGIAGALPGKNGVNSGDIKNNSIKSADVKNDALTGNDIQESTLKLPATAVAKSTFGVNAQANDTVTATTLPGVTVTGSGGGMTVNFPRSMKGCVPAASDGSTPVTAVRTSQPTGPGQENQVFVTFADGVNSEFNLVVTC